MSQAQKQEILATSFQAPAEPGDWGKVTNESTAILQLIERACTNPAVDIDKMERLMAMHERVAARNARAAYMTALSVVQTELPIIAERGKIKIGAGNVQSYAKWDDINEAIKPILSRHGFALSFKTGITPEGKPSVTGILSHKEGHAEDTTLVLPVDSSGSKNAVQAVGSSTSYGKRYTAAALLNLTSRGEDDDGKAAGVKGIDEPQLIAIRSLIVETGADIKKFCEFMNVEAIEQIPAKDFERAKLALQAKQKKAK